MSYFKKWPLWAFSSFCSPLLIYGSKNLVYLFSNLSIYCLLITYGEVAREKNMLKSKSQCNSISLR